MYDTLAIFPSLRPTRLQPRVCVAKRGQYADMRITALGSWADEMDSVPVPAAPSGGYGGARDRDGPGERRAFTQPNWGEARTGGGVGGGMGMGGRGPSFGKS